MAHPSRRPATIAFGLFAATVAWAMPGPVAAQPATTLVQYRQDDRGYRPDDRGYRQDDRRYDDRRGNEDVPGGSYLRSCGDARREGSTLVAVCRGARGARYETSIDLSRCGRSEIGNNNGTLQCGQNRGGSRRVD